MTDNILSDNLGNIYTILPNLDIWVSPDRVSKETIEKAKKDFQFWKEYRKNKGLRTYQLLDIFYRRAKSKKEKSGYKNEVYYLLNCDDHGLFILWKHNYCHDRLSGCPSCAGNAPIKTLDEAQTLLEGRNILILNYAGRTDRKSKFRCLKCGYEWSTTFNDIKNNMHGCPSCAGKAPIKTLDEAQTLLEGRNILILNYAGRISGKSDFRCLKCNYEWTASFNNIKNNLTGCPSCAESGFNPDKKALFYVIEITNQKGQKFWKYGITNRTRAKRYSGQYLDGLTYRVIFEKKSKKGYLIQSLENLVSNYFRYSGKEFIYNGNDKFFSLTGISEIVTMDPILIVENRIKEIESWGHSF